MSDEGIENILFLPGHRLEMPSLLFRGDNPAITPYFGLVNYGPYEMPPLHRKNIIILHPKNAEFEAIASKVKEALSNGYGRYFPGGFADIFGIDIDFRLQEIDRYDLYSYKMTAKKYYNEFSRECSNIDECFPVLLMNKVPKGLYESLYTEVKYVFSINGIPTQVITYETFSDTMRFKWSIFPLALQIFVKMGGVPFILYNRLDLPKDEAVVIIGLGLSKIHLPNRERRYVGFALAFEADGRWRLMKWSPQPYSRGKLADMLRKLIQDAVDDVLRTYAVPKPKKIHIIIHYSGKNVSVWEEEYLKKAAIELEYIQNIKVIPYIVKIQESMYRTYDEENLCLDTDGKPTYLTNVGTVIRLKDDLFMLNTTGCTLVQSTMGGIIQKPNAQGSPSPLIVSIKRLNGIEYKLDDVELIKSVFYMARMNYTSINNPVSKLPMSTKYSKLLAYVTARLSYRYYEEEENIDINSLIPDKLKKVLWFI